VLALAGLLVVSVAVLAYSRSVEGEAADTEAKASSRAVDDQHCPVCGRMLPENAGGECPYCKLMRGPEGKGGAASGPRPWTTTDYVLVGWIAFLVLGGGFLLSRSFKFRRWFRGAEANYITHCNRCHRKIRYAERQAGRRALCPACASPMVLPSPLGSGRPPS
jgi:hypothetical protein